LCIPNFKEWGFAPLFRDGFSEMKNKIVFHPENVQRFQKSKIAKSPQAFTRIHKKSNRDLISVQKSDSFHFSCISNYE